MNILQVVLNMAPLILKAATDVEAAVEAVKAGAPADTKTNVIDKVVDDAAAALKAVLHSVFK